ncbi:hypothetical protein BKA63DRAFT_505842 [Paraphoma chrysanthemicola]|nr:hypothetical protein BKA63DRAFT_505842 [Paraphoma chrysanthemicola]
MSTPSAIPELPAEYLADSKASEILSIIIIFPVLALVIVILRLYTRVYIIKSFSHDDIAITLAMALSIVSSNFQGLQVYHGLGRHTEIASEAQIVETLKALYGSIICWVLAIALVKTSIVLQYLRITTEKRIRIVCWTFMCCSNMYYTSIVFVSMFECVPIRSYWDKRIPGRCISSAGNYYGTAVFNIVTDITLLIIPFFILRHTVMARRQKITLAIILGLGSFATIASSCRIPALYTILNTKDFMWDSAGAAMWSTMELNAGILCASLATLRALIIKLWPRVFLTSQESRMSAITPNPSRKSKYYSMEGSIMIKKSITVQSAANTEDGDEIQLHAQPSYDRICEIEAGCTTSEAQR